MQVGWPKRKLTKLETALRGSYLVSAVLKRELKGDTEIVSEQLIGLIRCTSDRVFNATIWDVLVSPEYQVNSGPTFSLSKAHLAAVAVENVALERLTILG